MTPIDPQLLEQLSAWMDGELPADEARFLQRRLANDVALREQWERWQLSASCLHGDPVRIMDAGLTGRVAAGIAADAAGATARSTPWLASAAMLAMVVVMLPGFLAHDPQRTAAPAPATPSVAAVSALEPAVSPAGDAVVDVRPPMSPLPSVRDFPLVDRGGKAWPRSPILADMRGRDGLLVRSAGVYLPPPSPEGEPRSSGDQADAGK